jgi:hypothetical protein
MLEMAETIQKLTFSYAVAERAMARVYRADTDKVRAAAFRARINHLQRTRVLDASVRVGKGTKASYTVEQMERWLMCLELAELGISPTIAARVIIKCWKQFAPIVKAAQHSVSDQGHNLLDDVILYFADVHLMSGSWTKEKEFPGVPNINRCTLRQLADQMKMFMDDERRSRVLVTNLSARFRQFHEALAQSHERELIAEYRERQHK